MQLSENKLPRDAALMTLMTCDIYKFSYYACVNTSVEIHRNNHEVMLMVILPCIL